MNAWRGNLHFRCFCTLVCVQHLNSFVTVNNTDALSDPRPILFLYHLQHWMRSGGSKADCVFCVLAIRQHQHVDVCCRVDASNEPHAFMLQGEAKPAPASTRRRAQRAADRAHNDAVLSAAGTDEQVAQSLAQEEAQLQVTSFTQQLQQDLVRKLHHSCVIIPGI